MNRARLWEGLAGSFWGFLREFLLLGLFFCDYADVCFITCTYNDIRFAPCALACLLLLLGYFNGKASCHRSA